MHISLDQAIGRQPRLNRVGQSLLNIGSGASAAYSLRSLTGGDPKVVNVRRSSDNEEEEFTASDITSGALEAFVGAGNNGFVETWFDQSGNGKHAVQTAEANQPTIVSSGSLIVDSNSNPTLEFDGGDILTFTDIVMDSDGFSVFSFCDSDNDGGSFNELVGSSASVDRLAPYRSTNAERATVKLAGEGNVFLHAGNVQANDKVSLHTFIMDGTNTKWYLDSNLRGTADSSVATDTTFDEVGKGRNGVISEVIIYKDIDKSSDRTLIEGNMNSYYESF